MKIVSFTKKDNHMKSFVLELIISQINIKDFIISSDYLKL